MEGDAITMQELFRLSPDGRGRAGQVLGHFEAGASARLFRAPGGPGHHLGAGLFDPPWPGRPSHDRPHRRPVRPGAVRPVHGVMAALYGARNQERAQVGRRLDALRGGRAGRPRRGHRAQAHPLRGALAAPPLFRPGLDRAAGPGPDPGPTGLNWAPWCCMSWCWAPVGFYAARLFQS
jgi:hypothetical protein